MTIPPPVGLVNDFAGVIPPQQERAIAQLAEAVRSNSPGEIAIVTLADIGRRDPAEVALQIGREWGVGRAGEADDPTRNAGVVILVVPKETSSVGYGSCRVEVGRGAEGFITDAAAAAMCREALIDFVGRDYGTGIALITARIAQRFAAEFDFSIDEALAGVPAAATGRPRPADIPAWFAVLLLLLLLVVIVGSVRAVRAARRERRRRSRHSGIFPVPIFFPRTSAGHRGGGGGGGGGGWGGGWSGGSFGGGGFGGFGGGGGFSGGGGGARW